MEIQRKKIIIIIIYLLIFFLFIFFIWQAIKPEETCFDGIKNQNEQEADCGGICQKECLEVEAIELSVTETGIVSAGLPGKYDFFAKVYNPNAIFGSKHFEYEIYLKDSSEKVIFSKKGSNFILPGESKYVIEANLDISEEPQKFEMKIINSEWVELKDYLERPDVQVVNKNYSEISGGAGFSEAKGLLKNKSPYDFEIIKINLVLKDEKGKVLALNSTQMKTVKSQEERDFRVFWPSSFPGTVNSLDVQAEINIFDSDAFLERHYKREKFQEY